MASAPAYTQTNRLLQLTTPLGADRLLLVGLSGQEALSQLFEFRLDVIAENSTVVKFEELLGRPVSVTLRLPEEQKRYFHGIVCRVGRGGRDETFTDYRLEVVPQLWLLSKRVQSRIFQQQTVPDILKKVFEGLKVSYKLQGSFEPRNYCVQYRESDFHFASRLMEEEGIYYFFEHRQGEHTLVVADTPASHPPLPEASKLLFDEGHGGNRPEDRIHRWEKTQELGAGKYTLWDHCFELPHKHLQAERPVVGSVTAGKVTHQLKLEGNAQLEIYDYPGGYAQRFDGVGPGGGDRAGDLQKIFEDNQRTVAIRMQAEAARAVLIHAESDCRQLTSGHKFTLQRHFDGDGEYVVTSVRHEARDDTYRSERESSRYENRFTCIPLALPYRPPRTTPKPRVEGCQTAVVVGPAGEEIFTDKYGRVKVQFHWDRQGANDENSSCWLRVATPWGGKGYGGISVPRIGNEVLVDFLEGDPDRPIIIGSVYNADQMPPFALPGSGIQMGMKSRSSPGGGGANEITMTDTKGKEKVNIHAQYDMATTVLHDQTNAIKNNRTTTVDVDDAETVGANQTNKVSGNRTENVDGNESITIGGNREENVGGDETIGIGGNRTESVGGNEEISVGSNRTTSVGANDELSVSTNYTANAGANVAIDAGANMELTSAIKTLIDAGAEITLNAGAKITLSAGGSSIELSPAGITIQTAALVQVQGMTIKLN